MSRVYVGNLDPRVTERDLEDEFREYGVLRSVWVARRPPGYAFVEFNDRRDASDAIRDLDGRHGWRVELSYNSAGGGGGRGACGRDQDMKCYECGEPGHFARECRLRIGPGGLGSGRRRSPSPPRYRRSPSYGRRSYSPHGRRSPRRHGCSPSRDRSYSRSPPYRRRDSPYANGSHSPHGRKSSHRRSHSPYQGRSYSRSPSYRRQDSPDANGSPGRDRHRSYSPRRKSPGYHHEDSPHSNGDGHGSGTASLLTSIPLFAGVMGLRKEFLFLLILVVSWSNADARSLVTFDVTVSPIVLETPRQENKISEAILRDDQLCTLCENFTAQAAYFLGENKTQTLIIEALHQACSQMQPFEQQCILLVDYYASLFFVEIDKIHPEEFCRKVNLCGKTVVVNLQKSEETCTLCHHIVGEIITKLTDPDAQFEIIEMLMKECNKMDNYAQECKKLVFRYGPLILVNGEKFLETTDVCASIYACDASQVNVLVPELLMETSLMQEGI